MRLAAAVLMFAIAAGPAAAQAPDPIGDILAGQRKAEAEGEEPEVALDAEPEPVVAAPPTPAPPPRPRLTTPSHVDEVGKTPDSPPTPRDLAYESRVRASFASAQGFQGPLDGGWTLSGDGGDLYAFKLVDKGAGRVEGAWRDLRRPGAPAASGFVDEIERVGSEITLRFGPGVVADLTSGGDGRWTGQLTENGARRTVSLRRTP